MRRHDLTNMRTRSIDAVTAMRIRQYEQLTGEPVMFPVPIEKIVERILGLNFDWVEIEEQLGEQILAGLIPEERRIVLNSRHLDLFQKKPGLERSTRLGTGTLTSTAPACIILDCPDLSCRRVSFVDTRLIVRCWSKS